MWVAVFSGLIVSVDALFIGVSLGSQKRCKFWHLAVINAVLTALCFVGYLLGILVGDSVDLDLGLVIGLLFIALGVWTVANYFLFERRKKRAVNNIIFTGLFMSVEAMFITIGLTIILDVTTILIPLTVALAHFVYSTVTFAFAKHLRKLPPAAA